MHQQSGRGQIHATTSTDHHLVFYRVKLNSLLSMLSSFLIPSSEQHYSTSCYIFPDSKWPELSSICYDGKSQKTWKWESASCQGVKTHHVPHTIWWFFFWRAVGYICEICVCRGVCSCVYLCRKRTQGHMACEPYIRTDSGSGCEQGWSNYPYRLYLLIEQSITWQHRDAQV